MTESTRNEVIQETVANIKSDRNRIIGHISTISSEIRGEEAKEGEKEKEITSTRMAYKDMGPTLMKMIEALQRANEQLIKVAGVMQKEVKFQQPDEEVNPKRAGIQCEMRFVIPFLARMSLDRFRVHVSSISDN